MIVKNSDCLIGMSEIEEGSVDLIITDPPFGIEFKANQNTYNRKKDKVIDNYYEISESNYSSFTDAWVSLASKVLKHTGSMYICSGWNNLLDILQAVKKNNLTVVNHIIWHYPFGVYTSKKYITSHYHIIYASKTKNRTFNSEAFYSKEDVAISGGKANYLDRQDVWIIPREYWFDSVKTPNKLPRRLVEKMLLYSSNEGDLVLDPFSGSGQVPYIAIEHNRKAIGFEINTKACEFANNRIDNKLYRIK